MAEVTEHVTFTNRGICGLVSGSLRSLAPEEATALRDHEITTRLFDGAAPPPGPGPTGTWNDVAAARREFEASMRALVELASDDGLDLRAGGYEHPVFGLMDGVQWLLFAAGHTESHRAEITELQRLTEAR